MLGPLETLAVVALVYGIVFVAHRAGANIDRA